MISIVLGLGSVFVKCRPRLTLITVSVLLCMDRTLVSPLMLVIILPGYPIFMLPILVVWIVLVMVILVSNGT